MDFSWSSGCERVEALELTMRNNYLRRARVLERDFRAVLRCFAHNLPRSYTPIRHGQKYTPLMGLVIGLKRL
jgi:hypothetical protein